MKKKFQFSQLHVIFADLLVAFVYASNVWLSAHGFQPISDIAVAVITIYGGFATGGYFALCGVRDCSRNKLNATLQAPAPQELPEVTNYKAGE